MEDIDKEISEMKITLNARARIVAEEFLKNVCATSVLYCILLYLSLSVSLSLFLSLYSSEHMNVQLSVLNFSNF